MTEPRTTAGTRFRTVPPEPFESQPRLRVRNLACLQLFAAITSVFLAAGARAEPTYGERVEPGFVIFCLDREQAIRYSRLATEIIEIFLPDIHERPVTDLVPPSSRSLGYRCFGGVVDAMTPRAPVLRDGKPITGRYVRFVDRDGTSVFMDGENMNRVAIRVLEGVLFSATVHHDGEDHAGWVISSDAFDAVVAELPPLEVRGG